MYVEEEDRGSKPVEGVSTSTAGFLGETERGPTEPQLVTSFADFKRKFGGFIEDSFLGYAVDGFFRNGGSRCFVARVTGETDVATADLETDGGDPAVQARAVGPGEWGETIAITVDDATMYNEGENELFKVRIRYWSESREDISDPGSDDPFDPE